MIGDNREATRAVFQAICIAFRLAPDSEYAQSWLLRAYADPPPPVTDREANACYFDLAPDSNAPMQTERCFRDGFHTVYRFMPYLLTLYFYGPASERNAMTIRDNLFVDGVGMPRAILRAAGMYPVPPVGPPTVVYEEEGSLFRKRTDLVIRMKLLDNSDEGRQGSLEAEPIETPPETEIHVTR